MDGVGSKWTNSGDLGVFGTLTISGGGEVSDQKGHVGNQTGSTTIATVSGSGSKWTNSSYLIAGSTGNGEIMINGGGLAVSNAGFIGNEEGSMGLLTVDGNGSTWTNSGYLRVGDRGNGTLNITNGGLVSNTDAVIGFDAGIVPWVSDSRGEVTVSGPGSMWTNSTLDVGYSGSGILNIDDGGMVIVEGKTQVAVRKDSSGVINFNNGTLTTGELISSINDLHGTGTINTHGLSSNVDLVFDASHGLNQTFVINKNPDQNITVNLMIDGSGSIGVGYEGAGSMSISDGRVVESTFGDIGCKPGSSGIVTVDGVGAKWNNSDDLAIGISSTGTLAITNGGRVSNSVGYIATILIPDYHMVDGQGRVTVDGVGSTWTNSSSLFVGYVGNGTLAITGGGQVASTMGFIGGGGWPDSTIGDVTVDGNGSKWTNSEDLRVGKGTLAITDGAQVEDTNGYIDLGSVTVDGAGSMWVNSGELIISDGNGKLFITGGGRVFSNSASIGQYYLSAGSVTVDGANSTWYNNGDLSIGNFGDATLNITNGGIVRVAGTLSTNSYSTPAQNNHGLVNIANGGILALRGEADGSLAEFMDLIDGTDAIRYWDDSISNWTDILDATYVDDYSLSYLVGGSLDGYTVLRVGMPEPGMIGDSTHDGVVDAADAAILAANWQTASGALWEMGDFNGDGAVNEIDATLLAANWQNGEGTASVPEPSALVGLLGLCLAGLLASARRKQ